MSSMASSIQLLICLLEENNLHGIVSKTGVDAKELYYMIKFSLENLPPFLMPDMRNIGEKELFFNTPAQRVSKNNKATTMQKAKGLNNRAGWLPTAENSYDGRRLRTLILDEAAKAEEADITKLFSKISETLITGASVVGKVLMFSTVNEMTKGGANFKSLVERGNVTYEEYEQLRVNSYEQEALYQVLTDDALVKVVETHILPNCPYIIRPRDYNESVIGVFAPLLVRRLKQRLVNQ